MIGGDIEDTKKIKVIDNDLINFCHKKIKESVNKLPIINIDKVNTMNTFKYKIVWLILLFTLNEPENIYYSFETRNEGQEGNSQHANARYNGFIPKHIINDLYKDILELKENKNNDELFLWLYDLIDIILKKYSLKFHHDTSIKSLHYYDYDYYNYTKIHNVESKKKTICIFLSNLLANCLFNLNVQDSKLIEKNQKEIDDAKEHIVLSPNNAIGCYNSFICFIFITCVGNWIKYRKSKDISFNIFVTVMCSIIILISLILLSFSKRSFGKYFGNELITV